VTKCCNYCRGAVCQAGCTVLQCWGLPVFEIRHSWR